MDGRLRAHIFATLPYEEKDIGKGQIVEMCTIGKDKNGYNYFVRFPPDDTFGPHTHEDVDEVIRIISGRGRVIIGNSEKGYSPGEVYDISKNTLHGIITDDDYTILKSTQSKKIIDDDSGSIDIH